MTRQKDMARGGLSAPPYDPAPDGREALVQSITQEEIVRVGYYINADVLDDSDLLDRILLLVNWFTYTRDLNKREWAATQIENIFAPSTTGFDQHMTVLLAERLREVKGSDKGK